jgi:hypothetical protein
MSATPVLVPAPAGPALDVECRVAERHPCKLTMSCQPVAARADRDVMWPATVRDISTRGVGLVLGRRFEQGVGLAVEVPGPNGQPAETLLARVVHTTALPEGRWLLGCAFVSELSEDELDAVVRRGRARPEVPAGEASPSMVIPGLTFAGTGNAGRLANVPVRRLFLAGAWPPAPGTLLKVKVANQPRELPGVLIRVNNCVLQDGKWTLNYSFVQRPAPDVMCVFGYTQSLMDF